MPTIKTRKVKCPECGNKFDTKHKKQAQCGKVKRNGKRCGKRFKIKE